MPVQKKVYNFSEYVTPFIVSQDISINSRTTYCNALEQFIYWLSKKKLEDPTRETILEYKHFLAKKNLSSFTKSMYLVVVRRFFAWLEDENIFPNIARGIKGVKRQIKNHQKDSLPPHLVKQLLQEIDTKTIVGKRDFALINTLIRTGLRLKELAAATMYDLQQDREQLLLWVHGKGRSGKDDFVVLTDEVLAPLEQYLDLRKIKSKNEPLFASLSDRNYGQVITTQSLSRIIKQRLRNAGINSRRITAHSLRHTFGVLAMQAGASLYEVQLAMRHTASTTTQLYLGDIERIKRLEASPERKISKLLEGL